LALTARRLTQLEETRSLCANPDACILVAGDITGEDFVKSLFEETMKKFGRLDLLFNVSDVPLLPCVAVVLTM
jgi:NADP-dependent 3-hydroxy acid dehydrogenase YdfG